MLNAELVQEIWDKRHSHIFLGEFLNRAESIYLIGLLDQLQTCDLDYVQDMEIIYAAKKGISEKIPLNDTIIELKETNKFRENL